MPRHPPYALNSLTIKKSSILRFVYPLLVPCAMRTQRFARASYQSYAIVKEQELVRSERLSVRKQGVHLTLHSLLLTEPGGGERVRTDDLLRARQALSQLSYTPDNWWAREDSNLRPHDYQSCALAS